MKCDENGRNKRDSAVFDATQTERKPDWLLNGRYWRAEKMNAPGELPLVRELCLRLNRGNM